MSEVNPLVNTTSVNEESQVQDSIEVFENKLDNNLEGVKEEFKKNDINVSASVENDETKSNELDENLEVDKNIDKDINKVDEVKQEEDKINPDVARESQSQDSIDIFENKSDEKLERVNEEFKQTDSNIPASVEDEKTKSNEANEDVDKEDKTTDVNKVNEKEKGEDKINLEVADGEPRREDSKEVVENKPDKQLEGVNEELKKTDISSVSASVEDDKAKSSKVDEDADKTDKNTDKNVDKVNEEVPEDDKISYSAASFCLSAKDDKASVSIALSKETESDKTDDVSTISHMSTKEDQLIKTLNEKVKETDDDEVDQKLAETEFEELLNQEDHVFEFAETVEDSETDIGKEDKDGSSDESEKESLKQEKPVIDRQMYYDLYEKLRYENAAEKFKNNVLQKRVADYYRENKMHYVFNEDQLQHDAQKRYEKVLDELENLNDDCEKQNSVINSELQQLKDQCSKRDREAKAIFDKLYNSELELGKEFDDPKKEKLFEKYLKHQKSQIHYTSQLRVKYIKMRNRVTEKENALNILDNLGPGLHLIDYEQLKITNRSYYDRLDEKNLEMNKVRKRCQKAIQILTYNKEKESSIDREIESLSVQFDNQCYEYLDVREQLNMVKQKKDSYRNLINDMREQTGLLTNPKLLRDMQTIIDEISNYSQKVAYIKDDCNFTTSRLNNLRKNMSSTTKLQQYIASVNEVTKSEKQSIRKSDNDNTSINKDDLLISGSPHAVKIRFKN